MKSSKTVKFIVLKFSHYIVQWVVFKPKNFHTSVSTSIFSGSIFEVSTVYFKAYVVP